MLVAAIVLGGGTRSGFLSDFILQLTALPLLLLAIWRCLHLPSGGPTRYALLACGLIALVPLLQLIPLPPALWTALPNRAPIVGALDLAGQRPSWMPSTVSPGATWLSFLSLIVPASIFLATVLLGYRQRRTLSVVILAMGLVSVFLGLSQVAQGPSSPLRFFEISNPSEAVGFFANRNHCQTIAAVAQSHVRLLTMTPSRSWFLCVMRISINAV
jgi:hypothetical protein